MLTIYGIKNCSTMKKAFTALDEAGIEYTFFNYKTDDISPEKIGAWVEKLGLDVVLNKRGTTWRKQDDKVKATCDADVSKAIALMAANPSMIKRPMLEGEAGGKPILMAGFDASKYAELV